MIIYFLIMALIYHDKVSYNAMPLASKDQCEAIRAKVLVEVAKEPHDEMVVTCVPIKTGQVT